MGYRCASLIPLTFSVIMLVQGLFQIGIYAYFHQLAYSPSTPFFSSTYAPLWAGIWNFLASLSLIFIFASGNDKQWRRLRSLAVLHFLSILITQSICWILCEVLEFRLWLTFKDFDSDDTKRFLWAYIASTGASVIGVTIGTCGLFYIFAIFYRLANIVFNNIESNGRIRNSWGKKRQIGSAPAALAHRGSQTADSWHFVRFRSSTPKAKTEMVRRHRFRKSSRKRDAGFKMGGRNQSPFEISEEFNTIPLRGIPPMKPNRFRIGRLDSDDLQSPSLVECMDMEPKCNNNNNCDRATSGKELGSFFDESHVEHLINAKRRQRQLDERPTIQWPMPPPPTPASCPDINAPKNVVLPANAWHLPSVSKVQVAKVLNFSEDPRDQNQVGAENNFLRVKEERKENEKSGSGSSIVVNRL